MRKISKENIVEGEDNITTKGIIRFLESEESFKDKFSTRLSEDENNNFFEIIKGQTFIMPLVVSEIEKIEKGDLILFDSGTITVYLGSGNIKHAKKVILHPWEIDYITTDVLYEHILGITHSRNPLKDGDNVLLRCKGVITKSSYDDADEPDFYEVAYPNGIYTVDAPSEDEVSWDEIFKEIDENKDYFYNKVDKIKTLLKENYKCPKILK